ncbi:MAG: hypothetical protein U0525_06050 [Patescibacteria group bacterium]
MTDKEARYRRRYSRYEEESSNKCFLKEKSRFWNSIRNTLTSDGFTEIYLPVLEHTTRSWMQNHLLLTTMHLTRNSSS